MFYLILLIGFLSRLNLNFSKNIFHDELAYFNIARITSIKDILFINHWIKDHGIVYYLFLKPFILLTNDLVYLRLTNVFLYLISAYLIFIVFKKRNQALLSLLIVFLYSFHRYFIYLNAQISPFNLVLFFSVLSIFSLYNVLAGEKNKSIFNLSLVLFISSTILGFYSDYSFFYMGFFYLLVFLWAIFTKYRNFLLLLTSYLFILVFIIPGIFQFIDNFGQITFLFENTYQNELLSFVSFIREISRVLILRMNSTISLFFLGVLFYAVIVIKKNNNLKTLLLLANILILSFLMNAALLFLFSQHLFILFIERSFWFFNISLIILVSIVTYIFLKRNKVVAVIVYGLFCLFGLINYIYPGNTISDVAFELKYNTFIEKLINEKKPLNTVLIVDRRYTFTVLTDYYFSEIYPKSDKYYTQINKITNNLTAVKRDVSISNLNNLIQRASGNILIVLFYPSDLDLETARILRSQNKHVIIYYSKSINLYQGDFVAL